MPVYFFTFHAYLSWLPDRAQGYVEKDKGILPQDLDRAREYREAATHDEVSFAETDAWTMIDEAVRLSEFEKWTLYETTVTATHVHVLVGWRTSAKRDRVAARFKQRLGLALSKAHDRPGPWFSRGKSRKRVRERKHFEHLMKTYLPKHGKLRYTLRNRPQ